MAEGITAGKTFVGTAVGDGERIADADLLCKNRQKRKMGGPS